MDSPEFMLDNLRKKGQRYALAKAQLDFLDYYRKHLIATLMRDAEIRGMKTVAAQEREAYASETYVKHIEAIKEAQIEAANAGHHKHEAELAIEIWRTQRADERVERKGYAA